MTRDEAKALLPIIQAYTEGKTIQTKIKTDSQGLAEEWIDVINPDLDGTPGCYRIKPEPTYRPFKDADECWKEMQKHQPFGWVIDPSMQYRQVIRLSGCAFYLDGASVAYEFREILMNLTFADGEPFGVKQE